MDEFGDFVTFLIAKHQFVLGLMVEGRSKDAKEQLHKTVCVHANGKAL